MPASLLPCEYWYVQQQARGSRAHSEHSHIVGGHIPEGYIASPVFVQLVPGIKLYHRRQVLHRGLCRVRRRLPLHAEAKKVRFRRPSSNIISVELPDRVFGIWR